MDAIINDYRAMLASLPAEPDIVVYGDDLAYDKDLYFSEESFAFFIRPRLMRVFAAIRSLVGSEILFHSCGALPVLEEVVALGVRIINLQPTAAGMELARVRKILGPDIVFHGVLVFVDLSRALSQDFSSPPLNTVEPATIVSAPASAACAAVSGLAPPSISSRTGRAPIMARMRRIFSSWLAIKPCPPKPGLTVITRMR
jgi:hypothetical protein